MGSTDTIPVTAVSFPNPKRPGLLAVTVIGPEGGELSVPATGLRVVVPRGAVKKPTAFSVSLVDSSLAAYEFQPSGAKFRVPLIVTQKVGALEPVAVQQLKVGYFSHENQWEKQPKVEKHDKKGHVSELLPVTVSPDGSSFTFSISHFSGYIIAY